MHISELLMQAFFVGCFIFSWQSYNAPILQEPVQDENDIIKYCEESGLPVALDETIDKICENPLDMLMKYAHPGIVAVVSDTE